MRDRTGQKEMPELAATAAKNVAHASGASTTLFLALSLMAANCFGQQLVDPMRPPDQVPGGAVRSSEAGTGAAANGVQGIVSGPQRRFAIIDGAAVFPGGKIGEDARLAEIGTDSVTVREGGEREILEMFPNIEKKRRR
jgi:hypothetical protein